MVYMMTSSSSSLLIKCDKRTSEVEDR